MNLSKMQELLPNEVVALQPGGYITHPTNQVSEIQQVVRSRVAHDIATLISDDGLECQVLRLSAPEWKPGRLRLVLLFEPDDLTEEETLENNDSLNEILKMANE